MHTYTHIFNINPINKHDMRNVFMLREQSKYYPTKAINFNSHWFDHPPINSPHSTEHCPIRLLAHYKNGTCYYISDLGEGTHRSIYHQTASLR